MNHAEAIDVMKAAAAEAGARLVERFRALDQLTVSRKGRGDFVSEADLESEATILSILATRSPAYGLLTEEGGRKPGADPDHVWIVDPLDGTTNFLRGVPHFAVTIALAERGRIVAGVTLDPLRHECFSATLGGGAALNGQRLQASATQLLSECVINTGTPMLDQPRADFIPKLAGLLSGVGGLRCMGAAALDLAYVAAGRIDAYWEEGQAPWDIAAGCLMVTEAGGHCDDIGGGEDWLASGNLLACNAPLREGLTAILGR
jgi:myo-inositol-1(or 4)-monophosphatase